MRRVKGARHAHETIRASGRVPGEEARAELARLRAERKRHADERDQAAGMGSPGGVISGEWDHLSWTSLCS